MRSHVNYRTIGPTLNALLDSVEEFVQYHNKIDDNTQRSDGGTDRKAHFVGRLLILADELRLCA